MDIKELKQMHLDLSTAIQNMVERFEADTGTTVNGISLNRISIGTVDKPNQSILNVDVRVEL